VDFYLIEIISVLVRNYYYFLLYIVSLLSRAVRRVLCILYVSSDYRTCIITVQSSFLFLLLLRCNKCINMYVAMVVFAEWRQLR